jgi:hypothetical protein
MYADFADGVRHTVQFDEPVMLTGVCRNIISPVANF